jgi:hypothetical protein
MSKRKHPLTLTTISQNEKAPISPKIYYLMLHAVKLRITAIFPIISGVPPSPLFERAGYGKHTIIFENTHVYNKYRFQNRSNYPDFPKIRVAKFLRRLVSVLFSSTAEDAMIYY